MYSEQDFRVTRQRRIILEELRKAGRHPTACELYDAVKRRVPSISLATVYRNLELMAEKGLLQSIVTDGRQKRFDANPEVHYHAHCTRCGALLDIGLNPEIFSLLRDKMEISEHFEVQGVRIEVLGLCGTCKTHNQLESDCIVAKNRKRSGFYHSF